jgi:hypothetical protein
VARAPSRLRTRCIENNSAFSSAHLLDDPLPEDRHSARSAIPHVSASLRCPPCVIPIDPALIVLPVFARLAAAQHEVRKVCSLPQVDSHAQCEIADSTRELERDLVPEWRVKYLDYKVRPPPRPCDGRDCLF